MGIISIVVRRSSDQLQRRLEMKSALLEKLPFRCCWSECGSAGKLLAFIPERPVDRASQRTLVEALASLLTHFIIEDLQFYLLHDLIRFCYFYFGREERQEILAQACRDFEYGALNRYLSFYRSSIENYLHEQLAESTVHLDIEGFYNFRMPGLRRELWRALDDAVEAHLAEKEHREFVGLLRYFLNMQQPGVDLLHLSLDVRGRFKVMDCRFRRIDSREWNEFSAAGFDGTNDYEDIMVSMLVSIAPRRIMLHRKVSARYPRAVKSLRSIFEERLIFCKNCAYCRRGKIYLITGNRSRHPEMLK